MLWRSTAVRGEMATALPSLPVTTHLGWMCCTDASGWPRRARLGASIWMLLCPSPSSKSLRTIALRVVRRGFEEAATRDEISGRSLAWAWEGVKNGHSGLLYS